MDRFYSARPDGVLTLEQFLRLVPRDYRNQIEDDIDKLIKSGWGEITFTLVNGKLSGHQMTVSRKYKIFDQEKLSEKT